MCNLKNCNGVPAGEWARRKDGFSYIGCCKQDIGYYCVWSLEHKTMVCEEWAELCDLRSVLHSVRHIAFNVVQERQTARTALNNLKKSAPFSMCKRFPWDAVYVNLSCGVYANLWENILGALDFKDREIEKEMKFRRVDTNETHHERNEYTLDDAKTQFRNSMKKFQNELCKRSEAFDRERFEVEYSLKWCKGSCPKGPDGDGSDDDDGDYPLPPPRVTYGDLMKELVKLGFEPSDYEVFQPSDMKRNNFRCNRDTQELGPGLKKVKIPRDVDSVFVFTSGEYSKCSDTNSHVSGYVFDVKTKQLDGPRDLKQYSLSSDYNESDIWDDEVISEKFEEMMEKYLRMKNRYPNSALKKNKEKEIRTYAKVVASGSSDRVQNEDFSFSSVSDEN
jgi:hypothetical protein